MDTRRGNNRGSRGQNILHIVVQWNVQCRELCCLPVQYNGREPQAAAERFKRPRGLSVCILGFISFN